MVRPRKISSPYGGDLNKPIIISLIDLQSGWWSDDPKKIEQNKEIFDKHLSSQIEGALNERFKKLDLLFSHYNISQEKKNRWETLCYHLACDNIEGFKIRAKNEIGRPSKWDPLSHALLYYDIKNKISNKPQKNISWACKELAKTPFWIGFLGSEATSKTLQNEYIKAKDNPIAKMFDTNPDIMNDFLISFRAFHAPKKKLS